MMHARVSRDYVVAYPNPLKIRRGEAVTLGRHDTEWPGWIWCTRADGLAGWAPHQLFAAESGPALATDDYEATELEVRAGETVRLVRELNGWWWCVGPDGRAGWLPAETLERTPPSF